MSRSQLYRFSFYSLGLLILALGISLNTKSCLGVSPMISVAYSISEIFTLNFGNMTLLWYATFVAIEMILHIVCKNRRRGPLKTVLLMDLLQIPLSIIFTRFLNLFDALIPDFTNESFLTHLVVLFFAILFTGIGAAMSLNMRLVPNPGDGVVQAIADATGKNVGFAKNCFDGTCLVLTVIVSLALSGEIIGIGLGTLLAMVGVGRTIAIFNNLAQASMLQLATLER